MGEGASFREGRFRHRSAYERFQARVALGEIVQRSHLAGERVEHGGAGQESRERRFLSLKARVNLQKIEDSGFRTVASVAGIQRQIEASIGIEDAGCLPLDEVVENGPGQKWAA